MAVGPYRFSDSDLAEARYRANRKDSDGSAGYYAHVGGTVGIGDVKRVYISKIELYS